jgi:hypothetical protein
LNPMRPIRGGPRHPDLLKVSGEQALQLDRVAIQRLNTTFAGAMEASAR